MSDHLGDDAALYALGALDDREMHAAERHLESCDACRRLVARAESDVTAIASAQRQLEAPQALRRRVDAIVERRSVRRGVPHWVSQVAVAAAFVLALVPGAYYWRESRAMHDEMMLQSAAIDRVMSQPHRVTAFTGGPPAQVMYGGDGSWYCVIVRRAAAPVRVAWMHDGQTTVLGTAVPHGDVAMLYLPESHRMDQLALLSENGVVGRAQLAF